MSNFNDNNGIKIVFANDSINKFENEVFESLQKTFMYDLLFQNPLIIDTNKEFCDILVRFFTDFVIIQCKTCQTEDDDRLTKKTIVDGLNQLRSTFNRIKEKQVTIRMQNMIWREMEDFKNTQNVFPILIVNKKRPFFTLGRLKKEFPELQKLKFTPIIMTLDELNFIVRHLDTPTDLFRYFTKREQTMKEGKIIFESEIDLFSYYIYTGHSFRLKEIPEERIILLKDSKKIYDEKEVIAAIEQKEKKNAVSYWVDGILQFMFFGDNSEYLKAAELLEKLDRDARRELAEQALVKCRQAKSRESKEAWRCTILEPESGIGFVLHFSEGTVEQRNEKLTGLVMTAKCHWKLEKVLGISSPLKESPPIINGHINKELSLCYSDAPVNEIEKIPEIVNLIPMLWNSQTESKIQ